MTQTKSAECRGKHNADIHHDGFATRESCNPKKSVASTSDPKQPNVGVTDERQRAHDNSPGEEQCLGH